MSTSREYLRTTLAIIDERLKRPKTGVKWTRVPYIQDRTLRTDLFLPRLFSDKLVKGGPFSPGGAGRVIAQNVYSFTLLFFPSSP